MVLVAIAVVLVIRSREPDGAKRVSVVVLRTRHRVRLMVVDCLAILAGTVVTGTGPSRGRREGTTVHVPLSITWVTRIHSVIVWIAILMALSLLWHLRRRAHDREVLDAPLTLWICVAIAQGGVGYLQYANGVPATLVALHVALATTLWATSVWLWCSTSRASGDARSMIAASHAGVRRRRSVAETADESESLSMAEEKNDPIELMKLDRRICTARRVLPQADHQEGHEQVESDSTDCLDLSESACDHWGLPSELNEPGAAEVRTGLRPRKVTESGAAEQRPSFPGFTQSPVEWRRVGGFRV
jgi:hypothetical protein